MLDDCLGEKFEELLFFFSSAVLRKVLETKHAGSSPNICYKLGMATWLEADDLDFVQPLSLAVSRSLQDWLVQRQQMRSRIGGLATALRMKRSMMKARQSKAEEHLTSSSAMLDSSMIDAETMKQQIRDEHNVDKDWLEIGLSGDLEQGRDLLIEEEFENLWLPTIADTGLPPDASSKGLLADLESRVEAQKTRLASWKAFQVEVSRRNEEFVVLSPMKSPMKSPIKSPGKLRPFQHTTTPVRPPTRKAPITTPVLAVPPHKSHRSQPSPQRRTPLPRPASAARQAHLNPLPFRAKAADQADQMVTSQLSADVGEVKVDRSSFSVSETREPSQSLPVEDVRAACIDSITEEAPLVNRPQTPTEALFAEDADPSSVFKTRSKLRRKFSKNTSSTAIQGEDIAQAL